MGGGIEMFEEAEELDSVSSDLKRVEFSINFTFSSESNVDLFDRVEFYKKLNKQASDYLSHTGVNFIDVGQRGAGGGGGGTFIAILISALKSFNLPLLFNLLKSTYTKYLENDTRKLRPRIRIYFWIETNKGLTKINVKDFERLASRKLSNLLILANSLCQFLSSKNTYLNCDFSVAVKVDARHSELEFYMNHESRTKKNIDRFLRIINNIKVKEGLVSNYSFTNWFAISRFDSKSLFSEGALHLKYQRKYYLLFSTRIISDFFSK